MDCYQKLDKWSMRIRNLIFYCLYFLLFLGFAALLQTLYKTLELEQPIEEVFILPIVVEMPFRVDTWTKYAIAFLLSYASFTGVIICRMVTSPLIYALIFYTIAIIQHVQAMAKGISGIELSSVATCDFTFVVHIVFFTSNSMHDAKSSREYMGQLVKSNTELFT